jgi:hypothetical protein
MPNFTPEDLLLYTAGELSDEQNKAVAEELAKNWALNEKFIVLKEADARLDTMKLESPRKQTIHTIMRYAMRKHIPV